MRGVILSAVISALLLVSAQAVEDWGNCTRSTDVSAELRIHDCTDRVNKGNAMLFWDGEALMRRGQAYLDSGQYRLAIADYDHARSRDRGLIGPAAEDDVLLHRAAAYALLGDFQRADQDLDAALKWADQRPVNDPLLVQIKLARGLLVAVRNGVQPADVLRQVIESRVHQEK